MVAMRLEMSAPLIARSARGFTLIELLFAVAILAILLALGVPSFATFIRDQRLKTASFELQSALILARSEAIKRGPSGVVTVSAKSANWSNGWTVASGGATLQDTGAFERVTIAESGNVMTVTYGGDGRVGGNFAFSLTVPSDTNVKSRCIRIDPVGMPFSKTYPGGACN
ncbi:MAG: prepilin-type N-terminal cleavage/methylation domain-containing protein [Betaproteobacteria bacterium]|nr:prepilin-type N-terminal cleavage/methylation domain-containing protein [Betaproteobacteria bacterium]